jgi:hypothetical protein
MFKNRKIVVVMPAYNAAKTLRRTYDEVMEQEIVDRLLTLAENILIGAKLSEYHTGYRAFSRRLLQDLSLDGNSDDYLFDNQMLAQVIWKGYTIAEVSCPTKYFAEASSINLRRSIRYGLGCLWTAMNFRLARMGIVRSRLFR